MKTILAVFGMMAAGACLGAPTTEEMLAAVPANIIGPYSGNQAHRFTNWAVWGFSRFSERDSVTFRSQVTYPFVNDGQDYLVTAGFFRAAGSEIIGPTELFVETTRPDELEGGTWEFRYVGSEFLGLTSTGNTVVNKHIAYWTWTEDPIVIDPDPDPPVVVPSPIIRKNVEMGVNVGNAVSRAVRGKNERKALKLLDRQRRLLMGALFAE